MASDQEIKKAQKLADADSDINKLDDVLKKKVAILKKKGCNKE